MSADRQEVALIWAMTRNRVIGRDNQLPWSLKTDMRFFIDSTKTKPLVMGRKQYDSMGKALPGRLNIVITRNTDYRLDDAVVVSSMERAIAVARNSTDKEIMIIGGAQIYALALPLADRLYMTEIDAEIEGDTFFPHFELGEWKEVSRNIYGRDEKNDYDFTIRVLERVGKRQRDDAN